MISNKTQKIYIIWINSIVSTDLLYFIFVLGIRNIYIFIAAEFVLFRSNQFYGGINMLKEKLRIVCIPRILLIEKIVKKCVYLRLIYSTLN